MVRYSERPELWDSIRDLSDEVWPDRDRDLGEYWEPNVWIIHQARRG